MFLLVVILIGLTIFIYIELYQLHYATSFHLSEKNRNELVEIYPDTTINNELFKLHLKGRIRGKAIISALAVYKSRGATADLSPIVDLKIVNATNLDTTLRVPYYGNRQGDKIVLQYLPLQVERADLTVQTGIFGFPFEWVLGHF